MMLYRNRKDAALTEEQFKNPDNVYRGTPFWAWNCQLTKADVDLILGDLKKMGMGGAHLHSRTGMSLPYLAPEFMEMVRYAHEKCGEQEMLTWLYDEDRFPSGAAGGLVTANHDFRQRCLVLSPEQVLEEEISEQGPDSWRRKYLGKYVIHLQDGCLAGYEFLKPTAPEPKTGDVWYLYREIAKDNEWFNNQAYVDTLNLSAIDEFIKITYEAYYREFGDDFGDRIPAIFTDEPQFCPKGVLGYADEKKKITLPFTEDLPETYQKAYGYNFFEILPECIWELPEGLVSDKRYHFHNHICERFVNAFADNIGKWCRGHGIALTGHMMEEPTLASQTAVLGEAMRSYRAFDLPGIDMLYDGRELNTAKQTQSAVHQYGAEGMLSELYGVTGWDFDFRGHKLAGDWQAALGVTVRVHHLTWTSMAGEAKRDYPASIGYQSPWYQEYDLIENYFARLNTALTRGQCVVKVGVIHPIESYWLYWGPREQTQGIRDDMEENFKKLTEWLLFGLIDFDFISESLWPELTPDDKLLTEGDLKVGKMKYDVIIVPNCVTLRRSTLERLKIFHNRGGRVIFTGSVPSYIDAIPSDEPAVFAESCEVISFTKNKLLKSLESIRMIDIHNQHGTRVSNILTQIREDGENKWLFLAHCNKMLNPDLPQREELTIKIKGNYSLTKYDAVIGEIKDIPCRHINGHTIIEETVYDHDSLLYFVIPVQVNKSILENAKEQTGSKKIIRLPEYVEVELEEPNVLILDIAEARLDDGPWQEKEEILRIDNKFRMILGYPLRTEAFRQPWLPQEAGDNEHCITLRFTIQTETVIKAPVLALEDAERVKITLNGKEVPSYITGYYTDRSIKMIPLPALKRGENILTAEMSYGSRVNVEAMYLLGDMGVTLAGKNAVVIKRDRNMAFGDICHQGLPFYGGNLIYKIPITTVQTSDLEVEITQFRAPLIGVALDGESGGQIAFSPYRLRIEGVKPGEHILELRAYGNRFNTFGALHNCDKTEPWQGHPNSYRTTDQAWSYEYQIRPAGILISPVITVQQVNMAHD